MRQFGYRKYIPRSPPDSDTLDVDIERIGYHESVMDVINLTVSTTTPYDMDVGYLDWYYRVSHPCLVPSRREEVGEVLVPIYDEGSSNTSLSFISHELHRYLHHLEADEEDDDFVEICRVLRIAQRELVPQARPVP